VVNLPEKRGRAGKHHKLEINRRDNRNAGIA
jgi:hypothetical protein